MSGLYETKRRNGEAPRVAPGGSLGDMGTSMFATVGILAALYQRDRTGLGQQIDVAMLDSTVAMTDIITNYWSLGMPGGADPPIIMHGFQASDGWFILQVGRVQQFAALARLLGHPEWITDPGLADRQGWYDSIESVIRPAIEKWAADKTKLESLPTARGRGSGRRAVFLATKRSCTTPICCPGTCWSKWRVPTGWRSPSSFPTTRSGCRACRTVR